MGSDGLHVDSADLVLPKVFEGTQVKFTDVHITKDGLYIGQGYAHANEIKLGSYFTMKDVTLKIHVNTSQQAYRFSLDFTTAKLKISSLTVDIEGGAVDVVRANQETVVTGHVNRFLLKVAGLTLEIKRRCSTRIVPSPWRRPRCNW